MSTDAGVGAPGGQTTFGGPTARADTLADRRDFLTGGLTPLACRSCGTRVLVRKNSPKHTSIQWTTDPATSCPVYAEQVGAGGSTALLDTCERLTESVARAAATGEIEVGREGA
ncbi:MAG: hypothetical protein ACRDQ7_18320 [Haloechinothrix sp.]